ncbi:hypothetical protein N7535_001929 [Penicillium sp. DV-2018c]|nr:hypothetical protein N7461_004827 [Penicillium sp. DV-2018c]KAJ5583309.1 hypothetical protein N7535_001929 [Penicillium sp. DV-2018c]
MDHRSTQPLIEGTLERRSRAIVKGYSTGYYVVTPAKYLHEFKDNDDFRRDPTPELSLYLPDCIVGAIDGVKFNVKGKDVSSGKIGNAFHTNTELSFKAHTANDAEKWWSVIKDATRGAAAAAAPVAAAAAVGSTNASPTATATATSPATAVSPGGEVSSSRNVSGQGAPPTYAEKEMEKSQAAVPPPAASSDVKETATSPAGGISRTASTTSHFHTSPGGTAVDEKKL